MRGDVKRLCEKSILIKDELWNLYCDKGNQSVADRLNTTYSRANTVIQFLGFTKRRDEYRKRNALRYRCNNPFLVESAEKYYLLGYVLGDGSLRKKEGISERYLLTFSSSDYDHIFKLREFFGDFIKIRRTKKITKTKGITFNYLFDVRDNRVSFYLLEWGMKPRKSVEGVNLPDLTKSQVFPFLLGLIDSDGTVSYLDKEHRRLQIKICGHCSFIPKINNWLLSLGIRSGINVRKRDGLNVIHIYYQEDIIKLSKLMYSSCSLRLERKYQRLKNLSSDL